MCLVCAAADSTIKLRNTEYPFDLHVSSTFRSFALFRRDLSGTPQQTRHNNTATTPHHSRHAAANTTALMLRQTAAQNYETRNTPLTCTFRQSFVVLRCFGVISPHKSNRHAHQKQRCSRDPATAHTTTQHQSHSSTVEALQPKTTNTASQNYETQSNPLTCTFRQSFVILRCFGVV